MIDNTERGMLSRGGEAELGELISPSSVQGKSQKQEGKGQGEGGGWGGGGGGWGGGWGGGGGWVGVGGGVVGGGGGGGGFGWEAKKNSSQKKKKNRGAAPFPSWDRKRPSAKALSPAQKGVEKEIEESPHPLIGRIQEQKSFPGQGRFQQRREFKKKKRKKKKDYELISLLPGGSSRGESRMRRLGLYHRTRALLAHANEEGRGASQGTRSPR